MRLTLVLDRSLPADQEGLSCRVWKWVSTGTVNKEQARALGCHAADIASNMMTSPVEQLREGAQAKAPTVSILRGDFR